MTSAALPLTSAEHAACGAPGPTYGCTLNADRRMEACSSSPSPAPVPESSRARAPHRRLRAHAPELANLPGVWRADVGATPPGAVPSGHPTLDALLPGGGWPRGGLVELLSSHPGLQEAALLAPFWATQAQAQPAGRLAWVLAHHSPSRVHAPGLARLGVSPAQLWCLQPSTESDAAWAVEQMLRSTGVWGIWWITRHAQVQQLRRLQWAAQSRGIPVFVSRHLASRQDPSPAPLRLHLQAGPEQTLQVRILKRQGPVYERPLVLSGAHPLALQPNSSAQHLTLSTRPLAHVVDRPVPAPVAA